jgi:hypothetical protein
MVCYSVPLLASIILFLKGKYIQKNDRSLRLLNIILGGGAFMLVIDHVWNGELFLIGNDIVSDLLLGVMMTIGAVVFWSVILFAEKAKNTEKTPACA